MTLIVGVKCKDGVIIGADGAATSSDPLGNRLSRQPVKKLTILEKRVVVGVSGPVGISQFIISEIETLAKDRAAFSSNTPTKRTPQEVWLKAQAAIIPHLQRELKIASQTIPQIMNNAVQNAITSTMLAVPISGVCCLCTFDMHGHPEMSTEQLPFSAIGSGQMIAEPFLALLRRLFWPSGCPTLEDGTFAVLWTLQHAIMTNPGGVAEPIQIIELKETGARELERKDLDEHLVNIAAAEDALKRYKTSLGAGSEIQDSSPPSPPVSPRTAT